MAESKKKTATRKTRSGAAAPTATARSASRRNGKAKLDEALKIDQPSDATEPIEAVKKPRRARSKKLPKGLTTAPIASQEVDSLSIAPEEAAPAEAEEAAPFEVPEEMPMPEPTPDDVPDESLKAQLLSEFNALVERLRQIQPGYNPAPFMPEGLMNAVNQVAPEGLFDKVKKFVTEDAFDPDTWKGLWYMVSSSVQLQTGVVQRRLTGEYDTDEWGFDQEYFDAVRPFFEFMYKTYWRVSLTGVENVPEEGRALLVSNHSGQLPFDGAMLGTGILLEHPNQRLMRTLYATWFPTLPFVSDLLVKMGQALATEDNGTRLLENNELVAVFPEGYKGVGKLYKDRYKLARFGRGGFVKMAVESGAPIVPVAVVGAEETYPMLMNAKPVARLLGFPFFPITPTFPWLGPLGVLPLPSKWYIDIGEPIDAHLRQPELAGNPSFLSDVTEQVRSQVQTMIDLRLGRRKSVFGG